MTTAAPRRYNKTPMVEAAASSDVMRLLAHELRQPLSTIESIAYYLTLILPEDEKVREQLDRIQQLVEQSNWMLISSQFLSDPLPATREPVDLRDMIGHIDLTGFDTEIPERISHVHGDPSLLRALFENLVALFRQFPSRSLFRASGQDNGVTVELSASVTGHRGESSLGPGSSLSIQGARRVMEAFGGSLDLEIDPVTGIRLRVMLT